mgnify:CR=1 FL=1
MINTKYLSLPPKKTRKVNIKKKNPNFQLIKNLLYLFICLRFSIFKIFT